MMKVNTCLFAVVVFVCFFIPSGLKAQLPVACFTPTPDTNTCVGESVTFIDCSSNLPTFWRWTFQGGKPTSYIGQQPPPVIYNTPGTYLVKLVVCNSYGCDSITNDTDVVVNPLPVVSIVPADTSECVDTATTLTCISPAVTYLWSNGSNASSISVDTGITYTYSVIVTNAFGCSNFASATITVGSIKASIKGQDTICQDTLVHQILYATGGTAYRWSNGKTSSFISVNPLHTTIYSVVATTGSCSNTATFTMVVVAPPKIVIKGADSLCYGDSTTLTAYGGRSFVWNTGQTTSSIQIGGKLGDVDTITKLWAVSVGNAGCTKDSAFYVKVQHVPEVTFTGAKDLCRGSSTVITAFSNIPDPKPTYHWSTGSTASSITVTPLAENGKENYTVAVYSGLCVKDANFLIVIDTVPKIVITGDTSICLGDTTHIVVTGGHSYVWNNGSTVDSLVLDTGATQIDTFYHPHIPTYQLNHSLRYTDSTFFQIMVTKGSCSKDTSFYVKVSPPPNPKAGDDTTACEYDPIQLWATGGDYYRWRPALGISDTTAQRPMAKPVTDEPFIIYTVEVCSWGCCDTATVVVRVIPGPSGTVCCNDTIQTGQTVTLTATPLPEYPFSVENWTNSFGQNIGGSVQSVNVSPQKTTTYYVTFLDTLTGCSVVDSVTVTIFNCNIFVPDAFSPNHGPVKNRILKVESLCIQQLDFCVYDRWGNKVFETQDQNIGWDGTFKGKPMDMDTYVYFVNALEENGTPMLKKGSVTLVR